METPVIPDYITVHLGRPTADADNVRIPFGSYIKNVASSEIYPTWPENALRANISTAFAAAAKSVPMTETAGVPTRATNLYSPRETAAHIFLLSLSSRPKIVSISLMAAL